MSKILKGENVKKGKDRAPLPTMLIHHKLMLVKCCAKDPPLHNVLVKDDGKENVMHALKQKELEKQMEWGNILLLTL